jgi:hypothetical protein
MALFRKKAADGAVNTEGWMMSYADMATVLLAMFIVLSTLSKDQTGVSLQKGLESWRDSRQTFGLGGIFSTSSQVVPKREMAPRFVSAEPEPDPDHRGSGPDAENGPRSIDPEHERLQRFLGEMDRQFKVQKLPRVAGSATVDFYDRLTASPPYLTAKQAEVVWQVLPLLGRGNYRVLLIVWATMPSDTAWVRAAVQAHQVADAVAAAAGLDAEARGRLVAAGQPWRYAGFERPVLSLVIARTEAP